MIRTGKKRYSRLSGELCCMLYQFLVLTGNWQFFFVTGNFDYDRKKKDTVICLAGARSITTGKKIRYSRLSVGCAVLAITTGKKKDTVVCLAGA